MNTHELKTWTIYFDLVLSNKKQFEIRFNDRDFKEGDLLVLQDFNPGTQKYTNRVIMKKVKYILSHSSFVKKGFVVMGLEDI
jgi:ASC-1-like (ASCH) protein